MLKNIFLACLIAFTAYCIYLDFSLQRVKDEPIIMTAANSVWRLFLEYMPRFHSILIVYEILGLVRYILKKRDEEGPLDEFVMVHSSKECVVCMDKNPSYMYSCGHLNACKECFANLVDQKTCMVCRKKSKQIYVMEENEYEDEFYSN